MDITTAVAAFAVSLNLIGTTWCLIKLIRATNTLAE